MSNLAATTQIYNLNASATQFVFRGNEVRNGRRFGVLAKGLRLLVENNSFVGLGSGAVQLLNSPVEGLCARHALVRDNLVLDTGRLVSGTVDGIPNGPFWTGVMPGGKGGAGSTNQCHQDVRFSGNAIFTGPAPLFKLGGVVSGVHSYGDLHRDSS
jgi:hypothetical protein